MRRVYLIGGASAKGDETDAVVVYTPAILGTQEARAGVIFLLNMTLPHGTFYNDPYADKILSQQGAAQGALHHAMAPTHFQALGNP